MERFTRWRHAYLPPLVITLVYARRSLPVTRHPSPSLPPARDAPHSSNVVSALRRHPPAIPVHAAAALERITVKKEITERKKCKEN